MNKSIFGVIGFVLGAAAGSLVTWKLIEKKYMDMADDEIRSVKEMYRSKIVNPEVLDEKNDDMFVARKGPEFTVSTVSTEVTDEGKQLVDKLNNLTASYASDDEKPDYTAYSQAKEKHNIFDDVMPTEPEVKHDEPYIIDPTEFGEFSEYEQIELTYYKDGVICENDTDMIDPYDIFGDLDVGDHFGEYENDRVFVRDDKRQVDYEILRDERTFMEVL